MLSRQLVIGRQVSIRWQVGGRQVVGRRYVGACRWQVSGRQVVNMAVARWQVGVRYGGSQVVGRWQELLFQREISSPCATFCGIIQVSRAVTRAIGWLDCFTIYRILPIVQVFIFLGGGGWDKYIQTNRFRRKYQPVIFEESVHILTQDINIFP